MTLTLADAPEDAKASLGAAESGDSARFTVAVDDPLAGLRQAVEAAKAKLAEELERLEVLRAEDATITSRIHEIQRKLAVPEPIEDDFDRAQAFFDARKRWKAARPALEHAHAAALAQRQAHGEGPGVEASRRIMRAKRKIGEAEVALAEAELQAAMASQAERRDALRQAQVSLGEVNRVIHEQHGGNV